MVGKKRAPPRDVSPGTGIFGLETEYGFAVIGADGEQLDPAASAEQLMAQVRKRVPYLPCGGQHDLFIGNGSRVYIDVGAHPEFATAECRTPEEAVTYSRAGDLLLARAAQGVKRSRYGMGAEVVLWKGNVDHATKATWASHESYLHRAPQEQFARQLMTHLVTRVVYTGAGGFDNRFAGLRFVVSPRVFHLERGISHDSTHARGIFHTRDEPLAARPHRRLHVLAGESLWSQTADYLRVGTTALLVAQIDAGRRPQADLDLTSPLEAMVTIAADVTCTATVALNGAGRLTAIAIQRRLLEGIEADLDADYMPAWAPALCGYWRLVLDRLEASPASLIGVLDWPTKRSVLKRQYEAAGFEWLFSGETGTGRRVGGRLRRASQLTLAARLREMDMRFNLLDDAGIFATLDREGALDHRIVPTETIECALHTPPPGGRAHRRGDLVARLAPNRSVIRCNWDRIIDRQKCVFLDLGDPFRAEGDEWLPLSSDSGGWSRQVDPAVGAIACALAGNDMQRALREMDHLLASPDLSEAVCLYCADIIDTLVPDFPVPVLRASGDTLTRLLTPLFEWVAEQGQDALREHVGTLLYRCHEACARYALARPSSSGSWPGRRTPISSGEALR